MSRTIEMADFRHLYIDGAWVLPSTGSIEVFDSTTGLSMGTVPAGTSTEVDAAVSAAHRAGPQWAATPATERAAWLRAIADGLEARSESLAVAMTREVGTPIRLSRAVQVGLPIANLRAFADLGDQFDGSQEVIGNSTVVREPIGVVGAITPWNYPLHQIVLKVAPALVAGCTVVLKPSEVAPSTAFALAEVAHEIGLPAGVLNVVTGLGHEAGEALVTHPLVPMLSFTGSTRAGRRILELAAPLVKKVALELGGKSASVVLDDADLERAVRHAVRSCFANNGQTCNALTRLIVPRELLAEAESLAAAAAARFLPGDPLVPETRIGPLASREHAERVATYVTRGADDGARLLTATTDEYDLAGFFVAPAVFGGVTPEMAIAREEIFGPVLCVLAHDGEDDAVRIANSTDFGLAGAVWSADVDRADRVARRLRAGQVDINGAPFNAAAPFGGYGQSGLGREAGHHGLNEYFELKAIQHPHAAQGES